VGRGGIKGKVRSDKPPAGMERVNGSITGAEGGGERVQRIEGEGEGAV